MRTERPHQIIAQPAGVEVLNFGGCEPGRFPIESTDAAPTNPILAMN